MYLSTTHASANTYNNVRAGISTSSPPRGFDDELNRLNAMDSPHNFSSTLSLSRYPMHYNPQSSRQMNSQRPQRMQIIQDASETELVLSGNIAYNELKAKYIEAAAELRATQKLNSTYTSLLQYRNTLAPSPFVTAASTPPHGSSISLSASQRLPKIEFSFNLLTQSDCPNIRFFFKKDWQEYCHQRKNAGNGHTSMLGCLQDEDGEYTTTDSARLSRFYQHAKSIFNMFYSHFLDAESWGKTSSDVADYFYRAMAAEFPEFRFCNDGKWKARLYAIGKYPDWKRDYRDKDRLRRDVVLESLRLDAELKKSRHQFSSPTNLTRLNKGRNLYTLNSEKDSSTLV
ncbi:hypothetical protein F5880DRAFT_666405 [Lentinula raphanica]|nr:hypothetical protein F5880DRAFT_666405 [Lentinula raphanica]